MKVLRSVVASAIGLAFAVSSAVARPEALSVDAWRADVTQLVGEIATKHPDPYERITADEVRAAANALKDEIPRLDDKEIIVAMSRIAAMIGDGHTRLSVPRLQPAAALRLGHAADDAPLEGLRFSQLPVLFAQFAEGVFIVEATAEYADLIGARVTRYGDFDVEAVLQTLGQTVSAENDGMRRLQALDRLSLPEYAAAVGGIADPSSVTLTLVLANGAETSRDVAAITSDAPAEWRTAFSGDRPAPWAERDADYWMVVAPDRRIVQVRIDRIPSDNVAAFAQFLNEAKATAERNDARFVVDLRWCLGGDAGSNRAVVAAIAGSAELNRWGRAFVLTSPRTFSAAQQLVDLLEQNTRVIQVGEPTGSRPDHFGDARRFRLEYSGLTLRVSSLHWSSWIANDARNETRPHVKAPFSAADYFDGRDTALAMVRGFPSEPDIGDLVANALSDGDQYRVFLVLQNHYASPDTAGVSLASELVRVAADFAEAGETRLARFALRYGLVYEPDQPDLSLALRSLPPEE